MNIDDEKKFFFTGKSAKDNCELFGYKEIKPEDWTYYQNGVKVTKPKELKRRIAQERIFRWAGHRSFTTDFSGSVLPKEYFDILDDMGDNDFMHVIMGLKRMNAFAPSKQEGSVKKINKILVMWNICF